MCVQSEMEKEREENGSPVRRDQRKGGEEDEKRKRKYAPSDEMCAVLVSKMDESW